MLKKIKSISGVITLFFIGSVFILFLNGSGASNFLFQTQYKFEPEVISPVNKTDSVRCTTTAVYNKMIKDNPDYERRLRELETFTQNYIKNVNPKNRSIVTIPVVFHIVYKTPQQNISNTVIQSQIDVLNKDFRRLNADTVNTPAPFKPLGGDPQIEFKLAKRDPLGNPSIGITRTLTPIDTFYGDPVKYNAQGGHDIWDRDKYLNIWVCNLYFAGGYSQYPGGNPASDGVVINYTVCGSIGAVLNPYYNKGRMVTHEIGHWFNLRHIWGDSFCGNDSVADTPTQESANGGCPTFPHVTCSNGPNGDMFTNYMDYTFDACMNIYTIGQSNRMNAALYGARSSLLTSNGGIPVNGFPIAHFRSDKIIINLGQSINFFDESGGIPTSWLWTFEGGNPSTSNQQNPLVTYPNAGYFSVKLKVTNSFGTDSINYINYIKVIGVNMAAFSIVNPPSNTYLNTYTLDTSKSIFTWTKSGSNPTISYKWKIRKDGTTTDLSYNSNNNGSDSLIILRNSFLDSLAIRLGTNNDTVCCLWRVYAYNGLDSLSSQNQNFVFIVRHTVGIKVISSFVPDEFKLYQNYPNPFNPTTKIKFAVPKSSFVKITVYNILGKEMKQFVNEQLQAGTYETEFEGDNFVSGIYFYKLETDGFSEVKKMMLIK
jgi:PKD repeat protein